MLNANQEFCEIARLTESELFTVCHQKLISAGYPEVYQSVDAAGAFTQDFLYALPPDPNGLGSSLGLVAHLDIVGKTPPRKFLTHNGFVRAVKKGQPRILGADDRAGVFAIFRLLDSGYRPAVYFTTGEEVGLIGANALAKIPAADACPPSIRLLVEMDRQSWNEYTTYQCDSEAMDAYVKKFGYVKVAGSSTDIRALMPAWKIGGVNLSIGYNAQHSTDEHLVMPHCLHTIMRVGEMLSNPPKARIEFKEKAAISYGSYGGYSGYYDHSPYKTKTTREIGDIIWLLPKDLPCTKRDVAADHTAPSVRCVWSGTEWQRCDFMSTKDGETRKFLDGDYVYRNSRWLKSVIVGTPPPGVDARNAAPGTTPGDIRYLRSPDSRVTSRHVWTGARWAESLYMRDDKTHIEKDNTPGKLRNTTYTPSQLVKEMSDPALISCNLCGDNLMAGDDFQRGICHWCRKEIVLKLGIYPPPDGHTVKHDGREITFHDHAPPTEKPTPSSTADTAEIDLAALDLDTLFNMD